MNIKDIFNVGKIKKENEELKELNEKLKKLYDEIGGKEIVDISNTIAKLNENHETLAREVKSLEKELHEKKNQLIVLDDDIMFESFSLYKPHFSFSNSAEYKNKLDQIRNTQKQMIKDKTAASGGEGWTVNGNKAQGKKMVNDMIKLVLRSFNNECDYCVDNVKFNTIDSNLKRINQSFEALNKLGQIMKVSISRNYLNSKIDELHLALEYQQKKQEEKEEQKRVREELREQAKLEQEIRQAREKIEKERKHFNKALDEIMIKIQNTTDEKELLELNAKKAEIEGGLEKISKEESEVDYREKNAKAGYVYIISNIGAFGENVFKIGMTRRLEPIERIDELGGASVPFSFDVHAMVFSDNAPELEAKLHHHFYKNRINKLNGRKEFFKADIKEIEKIIKENYDKVLDIIEIPEAEQYRQGLLME